MNRFLSSPRCKRAFDVAAGTIGFVLMLPLMATIASMIWLTLGTPILYRQKRPGIEGSVFVLFKFRTMKDEVDSDGAVPSDEKRLTRVGRFLRRTSLDELPELWNVIRGDMSLVGPRPLLV